MAAGKRTAVKKTKRSPRAAKPKRLQRIDVHSHVVPMEILQAIERNPGRYEMRFEEKNGKRRIIREGGNNFPVYDEFHSADVKVAGMDRKGLDISYLSPAPMVLFYWLGSDVAVEASRVVNDGIANMVAKHPSRLRGMGTLPMQDPDAAVAELERIVKDHGFRAIELGTSVGEEQLGEMKFRPVLKRAEELKVFVFAHPYSFTPECGTERWHLRNLIGNPLHTTIMVGNLMFSGALDDLRKLKICLAHGGGFVPYQIGRFAHGHRVRHDTPENTKRSPYSMLRQFYFDALIHDVNALRYLIDLVGADRVTIGTDAPFDMGEEHPVEMILKVPGLTKKERDQILHHTAKRLAGGI